MLQNALCNRMKPVSLPKFLLLITAIAFFLNTIWENAQTQLFAGTHSIARHLVIYTMASVMDALYTVGLFLGIAILWKNRRWTERLRPPQIAFILLAGFFTATLVESWAIHTSRWHYSSWMPLIPHLDVGVSPVLQLMFLPLATFHIARRIAAKSR